MEQGSQFLFCVVSPHIRNRKLIWNQDQLPAERHGGPAGGLHQPAAVNGAEGHDPDLVLCVPVCFPKALRILPGADGAVPERVFPLFLCQGQQFRLDVLTLEILLQIFYFLLSFQKQKAE